MQTSTYINTNRHLQKKGTEDWQSTHYVLGFLCTLFHLILVNHPSLLYCYFHFDHRRNCNPENLVILGCPSKTLRLLPAPEPLHHHCLESFPPVIQGCLCSFLHASVLTLADEWCFCYLSYTKEHPPSTWLSLALSLLLCSFLLYNTQSPSDILYLFNLFIVFLPFPPTKM